MRSIAAQSPGSFRRPGVLFLLALALALAACGGGSKDDPIIAVIKANIRAAQAEDSAAYARTLDQTSLYYSETLALFEQISEMYDLKYEISDLKITFRTEDKAKVTFAQVTRKVKGPDFRDNRIEGEHEIRLVDGKWLLYSSVILKVEYLDSEAR
jgi:hypothetical protein